MDLSELMESVMNDPCNKLLNEGYELADKFGQLDNWTIDSTMIEKLINNSDVSIDIKAALYCNELKTLKLVELLLNISDYVVDARGRVIEFLESDNPAYYIEKIKQACAWIKKAHRFVEDNVVIPERIKQCYMCGMIWRYDGDVCPNCGAPSNTPRG